VLEQLDRVIESLRERSGEVTGTLNVGGPLGFGRRFLAGAIAEFQGLHPGLKVALTLSDVVGPADANRFDLIVHIGKMADSSVVAHPLGPNQRFICAAPSYLARRAAPKEPKELGAHDCIVLRENNEDVTLWRFRKRRAEVAVRVPAMLSSNDGDVVKQWALAGKGLFVRSEWDVAEHLAAGELVRVLDDWTLPSADVVALTAQRTGLSARAKLFLAFLQARFHPIPPWRRDMPERKRGKATQP
jgi:DNA-binding transcriptional LysR family regulator